MGLSTKYGVNGNNKINKRSGTILNNKKWHDMEKMGIGWLTLEYHRRQQSSDGDISTVEGI